MHSGMRHLLARAANRAAVQPRARSVFRQVHSTTTVPAAVACVGPHLKLPTRARALCTTSSSEALVALADSREALADALLVEAKDVAEDIIALPEDLQKLLDASPFKVQHLDGDGDSSFDEGVTCAFSSTLGDEVISVTFACDALTVEDNEDNGAIEDGGEDGGVDEDEQVVTVPFEVMVSRGEHKLTFECEAIEDPAMARGDDEGEDGSLDDDESVTYDVKRVVPGSNAEDDYLSPEGYCPDLGDLDDSLTMAFEDYLEDRGVNNALAKLVLEYAHYKENLQYSEWLDLCAKALK